MTIILIIFLILFNTLSWLIGWAFAVRFKSIINFFNYLQKKPEWPTKQSVDHAAEPIFAIDRNEATAIARRHKVRISDRDMNIDPKNANHT